jgi:putative ABC transport system ATP-binding protein
MLLRLSKIEKTFRQKGGKRRIINGLDLEIDSGEIVSITGKSGCGKTTLLNLIAGLTSPDSGSVYFNEKSVSYLFDQSLSRRRNRLMGFIFQTFKLLDEESVISNVYLPARIRGSIGRSTKEYIDDILFSLNIYSYRREKVGILSGGQKQRVAIARALVNRPSLILADEPTANLDRETSREIFDILCNLKEEGKALIIITHKDYMLSRSDRVYTMEKGLLTEIS